MRRSARQRGFTLVEMMVGMAILSVVALAMAGTFLVANRAVSNEARVMPHRLSAQRGQGLLLILAFVAAFLLVVWAALTLASAAFLNLNGTRIDTQHTYALDAGLAYAIETNDSAAKGAGCGLTPPANFPLNYGSATITVIVTITPVTGCKPGKPSYNVTVSAGAGRQLNAQISSSNAGKKATWAIDWEAYQ